MVKQYPHTISLTEVGNSTQDTHGNWHPGIPSTREVACRAEPNGKGALTAAADGSQVAYEWTLYFPAGTQPIAAGTQVVILDEGGSEKGKGSLIRFNRGQMNARAWL